MKVFLIIVSALLAIGRVAAVPARPVLEDPPAQPVYLYGVPDENTKFKCGKTTYTGDDIGQAARYGVRLENAELTRGSDKYPHRFFNIEKFDFPDLCKPDANLKEYPIKPGEVYNFGKNNRGQGRERVVYYYAMDESVQGDPKAWYCGIITHEDAGGYGKFLRC